MRRLVLLLLALTAALPLCLAQMVPTPTISNISPSSAVAGSPGFTLTVSGSNLLSYTVVRWNTTALSCTWNPSTFGPAYITCSIPAAYVASPGSPSVRAENYIAGYPIQYSNTVTFTVQSSLTITTACPMPNGTVGVYYSQPLSASGGVSPYAWSIVAGTGSPPPGLSMTGSTISGTPTATGSFKFTLRVTDYTQQSTTQPCAITINPGLTITSACPMPAASAGTPYSYSLTATGGMTPYFWSISAGALPPGLGIAGSAISGTPTTAGTYNFTLRVTDYLQQSATKACAITVGSGLTITTACPLPTGTVGVPYSLPFTATGGVTPYNWSIVDSFPPPGLSMTSFSGVLSGTPTTAGTFNFIVRVADYTQQSATKACSVAITTVSSLSISAINPPSASAGCGSVVLTVVGTGFIAGTIAAGSGSAVEFSSPATGAQILQPSYVTSTQLQVSIPEGLLINPGTATIRVINPGGVYSNAVNFTIIPGPAIAALDPIGTTAGSPEFTLTVLGSGFVASGTPGGSQVRFITPGGSSADLATTFIETNQLRAQVPASLLTTAGTARVGVVNPPCGALSNLVSFEIVDRLVLVNTSLPDGAVGVSYFATLQATGGKLPYSFTAAGTLPPGLRFTSSTGVISGTPTNPGTYPITAGVSDSYGNVASRQLSITVTAGLSITTASPLPGGTVGVAYSQALSASGGTSPYTWTAGLPAWLSLNSSTGALTGIPTVAGTIDFTVRVTDAAGAAATKSFTLTILGGLSITTASPLPAATVGVAYGQTLAATGGVTPYTWAATGLPAWLSLNSSTGSLSGTPTAGGSFDFTIRVTDRAQNTAVQSFTVTVISGLTITTATPLPAATPGVAYGQTLSATGGVTPYTWSATGLPAWLSLNPSTGLLSGIPAAADTHGFRIQVTDRAQNTATKSFSLPVIPLVGALSITTASPLPAGVATVPYSQTLAALGGSPPYRWSVSSGILPQGLSLAATTGVISGTPTAAGTANFTVQVTDNAQRTATKAFTLTTSPVPAAQYAGVTATAQPGQQPRLQLSLSAALAAPISGTLTLAFAADAVNPIDNPEVAFATGGRRADFTVPAGQTRAVFGAAQEMGIQMGTVAGAITVTAPPLTGSMVTRIARLAPTISSVRATRTGTGFEVEIIGYATPRSVTSASFTFAAPGADLQTPSLTVNVDSAFTTWYRNSASNPFGSQFRYVQPFTVSGEASAVNAVTVTLTNATGTSAAASANF